MSSAVEQIRHYYDRNTDRFLRYGQGGAFGAIHRAVWGPGVADERAAFHYVDQLIADRLRALAGDAQDAPLVIDLGCGVGASLCYLAQQLPIRGVGVTLSPVQVEQAARRFTAAGLGDRLRSLRADFCALPGDIERVDMAFAIEAFLHVADPVRFFAECARVIRPGGLLLVCDDMLGDRASDPQARRWLGRFRRGWHVHTLLTPAQTAELAGAAGFRLRETIELTPYLELGRARDIGIAALMRALGWLPIAGPTFDSFLGGHALQVCLERGYLGHTVLVLERLTPASGQRS
jgi:tocopherol O-methyltransferase